MSSSQYSYLYKTYKWQQIRKKYLQANPLCVMCEADGKIKLAEICDHIEPHKGDVFKFHNGPFQGLCKLHHDATKAKEESRGVKIGSDEMGQPIDQNSHWYK